MLNWNRLVTILPNQSQGNLFHVTGPTSGKGLQYEFINNENIFCDEKLLRKCHQVWAFSLAAFGNGTRKPGGGGEKAPSSPNRVNTLVSLDLLTPNLSPATSFCITRLTAGRGNAIPLPFSLHCTKVKTLNFQDSWNPTSLRSPEYFVTLGHYLRSIDMTRTLFLPNNIFPNIFHFY